MKLNRSFLTSKVARRIFLLFILCSIVPFLILCYMTYDSVSAQLYEQAQKKLRRIAKDKGFDIYEHLLFLESELNIIATRIDQTSAEEVGRLMSEEKDRLEDRRFSALVFWPHNGEKREIFGRIAGIPPLDDEDHRHLDSENCLVKVSPLESLFSRVLMYLKHEDFLLVGEINPIYLWGVGRKNTLPPEVEFMVHEQHAKLLVSSLPDIALGPDELEKISESASGTFESELAGEDYVTCFWSLFIRPRFSSGRWTIITHQLHDSIYEPIAHFKVNFLLLVLLTFWVVALLSVVLIRKSLVPINKLRDGTEKIAAGNFDARVSIKSGDEFESLGRSFNEMSAKLKEGQLLLVQAAKMSAFGQLAAGIVHEIGQPLTSISAITELLLMKDPTPDQKGRLIILEKELKRLAQIVHKFRSFTATEEDVFLSIGINDILDEVYLLFEHQTRLKRISFDLDKEENLPDIYGDANSLKQVFINLVINSMDALDAEAPQEPVINIRSFIRDENIVVEVEDNGEGIPDIIRSRIFEPFFTTKGAEKGSGLGLAIIESILHKHQARVDLKSEPGRGTTFTILFPQIQRPETD